MPGSGGEDQHQQPFLPDMAADDVLAAKVQSIEETLKQLTTMINLQGSSIDETGTEEGGTKAAASSLRKESGMVATEVKAVRAAVASLGTQMDSLKAATRSLEQKVLMMGKDNLTAVKTLEGAIVSVIEKMQEWQGEAAMGTEAVQLTGTPEPSIAGRKRHAKAVVTTPEPEEEEAAGVGLEAPKEPTPGRRSKAKAAPAKK